MEKLKAYSPIEYRQKFHDKVNFTLTEDTEFKHKWTNDKNGLICSYGDENSIQTGVGIYKIPENFSIEYKYNASFLHFGIIYEGITYTVKDNMIATKSSPSHFLCREKITHGLGIWKAGQDYRGVEVSIGYEYLTTRVLPILGMNAEGLEFLSENTVYTKFPSDMENILYRLEYYMTTGTLTPELQLSLVLSFISMLVLPVNRAFFAPDKNSFSKKIKIGDRLVRLTYDDYMKIQKVHCIISEHAEEFMTISQLANTVQISEQKLKYGFVDYYNKTIWELQNDVRMSEAVRLLKNSDKTTEEIAKAVGYQSLTAFHNSFRKWSGLTPGHFRKSGQDAV